MRSPDLFVVGAPKSGTTSLYEYLKGHPDVYMSPVKEPRYFAPDLARRRRNRRNLVYGRDLDQYLALFAGEGDEKRLGEASVRYLYSREAPALIRDFQAAAYIVVILRDPVEVVHALHGELLSAGDEYITDFAEALNAEQDRREGRRVPRDANGLLYLYRDRARFGEQLPRWFEVFGRERVHVMILDDLVRDPARTFRRLLQFLEVDPEYQPESFSIHNRSRGQRSRLVRSMLKADRPRRMARLLPQSLRARLRERVIRPLHGLNRRQVVRPPMSVELRRRLEEEFAADVNAVSQLLQRDLAALWWGRETGERRGVPEAAADSTRPS